MIHRTYGDDCKPHRLPQKMEVDGKQDKTTTQQGPAHTHTMQNAWTGMEKLMLTAYDDAVNLITSI